MLFSQFPGPQTSAKVTDRQRRIREHLARSAGEFVNPGPRRSEPRKQQIMDHVRRSRG
jgi:hypothetical protein